MGGQRAIPGPGGPAIGIHGNLGGTQGNHGLDGEGHAGDKLGSDALFAPIGDLGLLVHAPSDPMTNEFTHNAQSKGLDDPLDGGGDVPNVSAGTGRGDAGGKGSLGGRAKSQGGLGDITDGYGTGIVPNKVALANDDIEGDKVTLLEDTASVADAVDDLVVDRDADLAGVSQAPNHVAEAGAGTAMKGHEAASEGVEFTGRDPWGNASTKVAEDSCRGTTSGTHAIDVRLAP